MDSRRCFLTDQAYVIGYEHFECVRVCWCVRVCGTWMFAEPPVRSQMCLQLPLLSRISAVEVENMAHISQKTTL